MIIKDYPRIWQVIVERDVELNATLTHISFSLLTHYSLVIDRETELLRRKISKLREEHRHLNRNLR